MASRLALTNKEKAILVSPVLVVGAGAAVIRLFQPALGEWAWLPWILSYWLLAGGLAWWGGGRDAIRRWLAAPAGHAGWSILAVVLGLSSSFMLFQNWELLRYWPVAVGSLAVGLINPFLEEFYWRGLLLDAGAKLPAWLVAPLVTAFFSLNHLLAIGYTSVGCRHPMLLVNTFVAGILFSIVYKKTGSLRWAVVSHMLTDLFSLSVAVFLNLWVPPAMF